LDRTPLVAKDQRAGVRIRVKGFDRRVYKLGEATIKRPRRVVQTAADCDRSKGMVDRLQVEIRFAVGGS